MAPIYDTDIAQQRWDKADWENYELWEKVEHRARSRRRLWIAAALAGFLALSSVPIVIDRWDKWSTLSASRRLAEEVNRLKREAGLDHAAYRIRFAADGSPTYRVERSASCSDPASTVVRSGALFEGEKATRYLLLNPAQAEALGVPGLIQDLCYDFLAGSDVVLRADAGSGFSGFGIIPAKDLAEMRQDRMSVLLVSGLSADPSFD